MPKTLAVKSDFIGTVLIPWAGAKDLSTPCFANIGSDLEVFIVVLVSSILPPALLVALVRVCFELNYRLFLRYIGLSIFVYILRLNFAFRSEFF